MTDIPISDSPQRMGRPPLKKDTKTTAVLVRLPVDLHARLKAVTEENRVAEFIRELIEREVQRLERLERRK